ncbi:MBL fold metallo-hydrolase [Dokdonella soli]|uniref:MBL fold metallo-hydrolase n=1 Tax=Dokdonella soli TaxID=529810 RepID=A0ABP3TRC2_9GAMM
MSLIKNEPVMKDIPAMRGRRDFLRSATAMLAAAKLGFPRNAIAEDPAPLSLRAQRLAWAGVRLQLETGTLFLDPLTNRNVWGTALKDPLIPVTDATGDRFVVVTHRHPDHCDPDTIRQALGDDGTLAYAANAGVPNVPGVKMRAGALYEPLLLGDFTATAVPAVDGYGDPQVSWIINAGGKRIIHCGDTLWHGSWWHIGRQYGPFDAAFLPINGARFSWRKPVSDVAAVMTAEQAVAAAVVIGARLIVPIHYGVVGAEGYSEDPHAEEELQTFARKRHVAVEILKPGAWLSWRT